MEEYAFDYVIIGGGTAGCVLANRLSEDPTITVLLVEGGPNDQNLPEVLELKQWLKLLNSPLDYAYPTTDQPRGNSHIIHSRAKVLGGCSSHNTLISFFPFPEDLDDWVKSGARGWEWKNFKKYGDKIKCHIQPVEKKDRNELALSFIESTKKALNIEQIEDFAAWKTKEGGQNPWIEGVGWLSVAYTPQDGKRSSASVAYIHEIIDKRKNLTIWFESWASKLILKPQQNRISGLIVELKDGTKRYVQAKKEFCLCAGAIDTPRLLLLSGIGPRSQLEGLKIPVLHELRGVGENLLDHPETIIMWKTGPHPAQTVMKSDAAYFNRRSTAKGNRPDMMSHTYQVPFCDNTVRLGYSRPEHAFCITPNIPQPKSKGRLYLTSSNPKIKPALDFRYFTDPEDYDAKCLVEGIKQARKIANEKPLKDWLIEEIAPGPKLQTDEELNEYARRVAHTVYHPAGTCKMGDEKDDDAVVDPYLKIRGLSNIRIADASIFPTMVTPNPMITVLMIAEKASHLILSDHQRRDSKL
ncbi:uncharacterized protein MELLADRAFT_69449 [Melampsora larici-populina 98AG31]|uniref:Glucose-methanol-choline oxidoreductase N-terminal domain-containing protein n=1 Tax=Melampsora larici-populina (strain 98AG31 / pathotype 3-4-7) TaxID=747676 RepID=F4SAT4_MELLP|nr:uncharacterized protein MELLADRAFT_69449 [Melampsora larici-populina 98AG31]EGF98221.1 hypothetical protein MELLADRAFT_69449 [Melampsora larici-populina 98AG31]